MQRCSLFFVVVIGIVAVNAQTNYCDTKLCKPSKPHIACNNDGKWASICPKDAELVTITPDMQSAIINAHNEKRNFIAGGGDKNHAAACRMATMTWNDELASLAALNVRQCKIKHDDCRNTATFKHSGQNLHWSASSAHFKVTAANFVEGIEKWFSEVQNSTQAFMDSCPGKKEGKGIGHFAVMMAEKNIQVGCAASKYVDSRSKVNFLMACNYATNIMGGYLVYTACAGAPASKCTTGKNKSYPNLCSVSEAFAVNSSKG